MFVYVLTGRASKPVLCSFYMKSTEQLNYFQKTGLRALNIVCGQRSTSSTSMYLYPLAEIEQVKERRRR
jgi:hypothetical protein